ncbi:MAG: hypothetical protein CSA55_00300 [Ilumatobacter coccineus]|uniref:Tyrosine specific protein phosphatases domain-containing protein n=1 Tax=Ilumatobacter coccineus TaxID=467094 RepID=A0A2G6KH82_9ACTN|nr:MAG: hypothetical protein CSA55_00300 [Ilumatobacter coccineus]
MTIDHIPTPSGKLYLTAVRDVAHDPVAALASVGATTMVCLAERGELESRHPAYLEWIRAQGTDRAIWFPIQNYGARDADYVAPVVSRIVDRLAGGVIMHCYYGQGRAGTMAAAVLMAMGLDQAEAVRTVAAHRFGAGPASGRQWDLLEALAR